MTGKAKKAQKKVYFSPDDYPFDEPENKTAAASTTRKNQKTRDPTEEHYDDCGESLSADLELESDRTAPIAGHVFIAECHESSDSSDEGREDTEAMFESAFMTYFGHGSSDESETVPPANMTTHFPNMSSMLHFLANLETRIDVCELFGGVGGVTKIAIRRRLHGGAIFDPRT